MKCKKRTVNVILAQLTLLLELTQMQPLRNQDREMEIVKCDAKNTPISKRSNSMNIKEMRIYKPIQMDNKERQVFRLMKTIKMFRTISIYGIILKILTCTNFKIIQLKGKDSLTVMVLTWSLKRATLPQKTAHKQSLLALQIRFQGELNNRSQQINQERKGERPTRIIVSHLEISNKCP